MQFKSWSDQIGIIDIAESPEGFSFFYMDDGSLMAAISIEPFDDLSLNEDTILHYIHNYITQILKTMEDGEEYSIVQYPERDIELYNNFKNNCKPTNVTIKKLNDIYIKEMDEKYQNYGISKLNMVMFFRFFPTNIIVPSNKKKSQYKHKTWDNIMSELEGKLLVKHAGLTQLGLNPHHLNTQKLLKLANYLINPYIYLFYPEHDLDIDYNYIFYNNPDFKQTTEESSKSVNEQIAVSSLYPDLKDPYFIYDDEKLYMKAIKIIQYPNNAYYGITRALSSLPIPHFFITNIRYSIQATSIAEQQRKIKTQSSYLRTTKDVSIDSEEQLEDRTRLLAEVEREGHSLVEIVQTLILFNNDKENLNRQAKMIMSNLRSNQIIATCDNGQNEDNYINSIPFKSNMYGSTTNFLRQVIGIRPKIKRRYSLSTTTKVLPALNTFFNSAPGHQSPYVMFYDDRTGRPVGIDPFDTGWINAPNCLVTGGTGAGKTHLVRILTLRLMNRPNPVYLISLDKGATSHKNIYNYFDGVSLSINPNDADSCLNIFDTTAKDIDKPGTLEGKEKLKDITAFLITLSNPINPITDYSPNDKMLLEKSIQECYAKHKKFTGINYDTSDPTTFPILSNYLKYTTGKEYKDNNFMKTLLKNLSAYPNSSDHLLVNSHSPNFTYQRMMSFDIETISKMPDMLAPVVIQIGSYMKNMVDNIRSTHDNVRWMVFIDEMWEFMRSKSFIFIKELIESLVREARKKGGMVINCSQDLSDFEGGAALLNNSPLAFYGKAHSESERQLIVDTLKLNPEEAFHLSDCGVKGGEYSKFFLVAGNLRVPIQVIATAVENALYTTDPNDYDHQQEFYKKYKLDPKSIDSIIQYAEKYPLGHRSVKNRI